MFRTSTILSENAPIGSQPSSLLSDGFIDVDTVKSEDVLNSFTEPLFKEEPYSVDEKPEYEEHPRIPKPAYKSRRKRMPTVKKLETDAIVKGPTKKKIVVISERQSSELMSTDLLKKEIKTEEEINDYEGTTLIESVDDPAIHCTEKETEEKNKDAPCRATTKQVRKPLVNFFNPPQRPKELNRPIPEMTLSPKMEEFENAFMTERMMLGLWHSILIPSDDLVQKFGDLDILNMAGTVVCDDYRMQDMVNWSNYSLIYNGWDNRANRVCVKVSTMADNMELVEKLLESKRLRQNHPHLLIPFGVGTLGCYHISVSKLHDVNLERIRKIYHFALTDDQIFKVMTQLIGAVAEIHKLGFIHADICPANVLFRNAHLYQQGNHAMLNEIHILLTDYNSCITMSDNERQNVGMIQQASYRAPEVLLGHKVDSRVDMWSVGILAIDLIYPGHWSLEEYDISDPVKAGEHLYRIDRNIYSMDWNMFADTFIDGNQHVYWSYQDYYKKRKKLNFPPYNDTEEKLRELLKALLQTNPKTRLSSKDAASKYPCHDDQAGVTEELETFI